jgi:hypothetical protein
MKTNDWKRFNIDIREFYQSVVEKFNAATPKQQSSSNVNLSNNQGGLDDMPFVITLLIGLSLVLPF